MYRAVAPIHSGLVVRTFHFPLQDCEDGGKWAYYLLDTAIELIVTIIRAQFLPATRDCGVSGDVESTYFTEWAGIYFADSEAWGQLVEVVRAFAEEDGCMVMEREREREREIRGQNGLGWAKKIR